MLRNNLNFTPTPKIRTNTTPMLSFQNQARPICVLTIQEMDMYFKLQQQFFMGKLALQDYNKK